MSAGPWGAGKRPWGPLSLSWPQSGMAAEFAQRRHVLFTMLTTLGYRYPPGRGPALTHVRSCHLAPRDLSIVALPFTHDGDPTRALLVVHGIRDSRRWCKG
jgi:hypothetical protein